MKRLILLSLSLFVLACDGPIMEETAEVKRVATGFKFTEGPAANSKGDVYFTDVPNNRIHKWDVGAAKLSTFRENTEGANGLWFDSADNLYICQGNAGKVIKITTTGKTEVLAATYKNKKFNRPNDLWRDAKGGIYFSDPLYGRGLNLPQDGEHVYYLSPDGKNITRVINDMKKPNGIVGHKDGSRLYVTDHGGKKTFSYSMNKDGSLSNKKLVCEIGSDGMTVDSQGNLYITSDLVYVYNSSGEEINKIKIPERPSNVCFGGKDFKTLYVTAHKGLYAVEMLVVGQKPN
jgi:gluconolactonase